MFFPKRVPKLVWLAVLLAAAVTVFAACGGGHRAKTYSAPTRTPATSGSPTPAAAATTAEIKMIPTIKFDKASLTIAANKDVTITVDNTDTGVTHNFAVYKSKADAEAGKPALAKTSTCAGTCKETLTLKLAPGEYFFRCDVHPTQMTGTLIVK